MKNEASPCSMTGSRVGHDLYVALRTICTSNFLAQNFFNGQNILHINNFPVGSTYSKFIQTVKKLTMTMGIFASSQVLGCNNRSIVCSAVFYRYRYGYVVCRGFDPFLCSFFFRRLLLQAAVVLIVAIYRYHGRIV